MLSRTAENLYWMSRYIERAENTARTLDVSFRTSLLPSTADKEELHWRPAVMISPDPSDFDKRYGEPTGPNVMQYLALDRANPSSIVACIDKARENARSERSAITTEMWESLNATWLELNHLKFADLEKWGLREFFDWVKERSHLFRGVSVGTMYRDDAFHFIRLGTFIERADNTARILDVKYHMLLPDTEKVGGYVDYYQWGALLRSVSAFRAYRKAYRDTVNPLRIAEIMVLNADMPRSLLACFEQLIDSLEPLVGSKKLDCMRVAGQIYSELRYGKIEQILQAGLHEYLEDFMARNNALGEAIQRDFMMTSPVE
ncbi:MAG: alpha-E domain-containing protein [Alphaproteobacteria bacterium]